MSAISSLYAKELWALSEEAKDALYVLEKTYNFDEDLALEILLLLWTENRVFTKILM